MGALYQIEFPNGKSYIGITKGTTEKRFDRHCSNVTCSDKKDLALYRALRKYGTAAATCRTLVVADWSYLVELEKKAIAAYGTKFPSGYNLTDGGEGNLGQVVSDETRKLMSEKAAAAWKSEQHRARMSQMRTGKKQSESTKQKRAEAVREAWNRPGYREAVKEKQRQRWAARKASIEG